MRDAEDRRHGRDARRSVAGQDLDAPATRKARHRRRGFRPQGLLQHEACNRALPVGEHHSRLVPVTGRIAPDPVPDAVDLALEAEARHDADRGRTQRRVAAAVEGARDRVRGLALERGGDRQRPRLASTEHVDAGQRRGASGERAGLVEHDDVDLGQLLEHVRLDHEDAERGESCVGRRLRGRNRQRQRARAGHGEHREHDREHPGGVDRGPPEADGHDRDQQADDEAGGDLVGDPRDPRPARLRTLDQAQDLGDPRLGAGGGHAQVRTAGDRVAAGQHRIPGALRDRP